MTKTLGLAMMLVLGMFFAAGGGGSGDSRAQTPRHADHGANGKEMALDLGNNVTMKLVRIPAGKFLMGSPETEKDRDADEVQHEVTISKPFYMGITHVTVNQFAAFVKDSGYKTDAEREGWSLGVDISKGELQKKRIPGASWRNPSFEQTGDHPVVQVSWDDARMFCEWLSKRSGRNVCLPTEAQWEYACRAGTRTACFWGDNPDDGKGWANGPDQSLSKTLTHPPTGLTFFTWDDGYVFTSPVGRFKPNAFGLYDMIGNVTQWCSDWHEEYKTVAVTDPTGAATGRDHILRGGAWYGNPAACRSAIRGLGDVSLRSVRCGFRVTVAITSED
jgi:formylglycine-generating enzyme required for sulfatase activity